MKQIYNFEKEVKEALEEMLEKAQNKKYYAWEYTYSRYNPQLGIHTHTSMVIAPTKAAAETLAKNSCKRGVYGSNSFIGISAKSEALTKDQYRLEGFVRTEDKTNWLVYKV